MNGATDKPGIRLACCGLIGTVVPDEGLIERCFAEAIATQGVVSGTSAFARRMAQVHQARGQAPGDVLRMLFPDNEARAQAAQLAFDRALADALRRVVIQPVPGTVQVLDQLREAGCKIAVLTSLPRSIANTVLDAAGLWRSIDVALSAQEVPRGFPAPDLVLTAVLQCGTGAVADVAVIHSTSAGVESGRRSGASIVVGVLTGPHSAARLRASGATHILGSIADVPALLSAGDGAGPHEYPAEVVPAQARSEQRTTGL
jgi:phosphoglycolate phosphatase